jgi:hypothetical protein
MLLTKLHVPHVLVILNEVHTAVNVMMMIVLESDTVYTYSSR